MSKATKNSTATVAEIIAPETDVTTVENVDTETGEITTKPADKRTNSQVRIEIAKTLAETHRAEAPAFINKVLEAIALEDYGDGADNHTFTRFKAAKTVPPLTAGIDPGPMLTAKVRMLAKAELDLLFDESDSWMRNNYIGNRCYTVLGQLDFALKGANLMQTRRQAVIDNPHSTPLEMEQGKANLTSATVRLYTITRVKEALTGLYFDMTGTKYVRPAKGGSTPEAVTDEIADQAAAALAAYQQ